MVYQLILRVKYMVAASNRLGGILLHYADFLKYFEKQSLISKKKILLGEVL